VFAIPEPARRSVGRAASTWGDFARFMSTRRAFFAYHLAGFSLAMTAAYAIMFWVPVILARRYGWHVGQVSLYYGTFTASVGILGLLMNGRVVDRMLSRGINDAHMRYYAWGSLAIVASAVTLVFAPTGLLFLVALAPVKLLFQFTGVSAAAIQVVTPSALRGRVSAVYLLVISLVGITAGPASVAFFTDYVFHDDSKVAWSLAAAFAVLGPSAALLFWLGMKPMRAAVAIADAA
jgi:MFS family permease